MRFGAALDLQLTIMVINVLCRDALYTYDLPNVLRGAVSGTFAVMATAYIVSMARG